MRSFGFLKAAMVMIMVIAACIPFAKAQEYGTETNPYLIESLDELKAFRDGVNSTATYGFFFHNGTFVTDTTTEHLTGAIGIPRGGEGTWFKLTTDIVINSGNVGGCNGNNTGDWEEWVPIGWNAEASQSFNGHFDGDYHTISGIYINGSEKLGLFGSISDASVKNVAVTNSYIKGDRIIGGICGWNVASTISHCWSSATIVADRGSAGGIAGNNTSSASTLAKVEYCYNAGLVRAFSLNGGGIVGLNTGGMVKNCYNSNSILGSGDVCGAITGSTEEGGEVTDCYYDNLFAYTARDGATAASTNQMTTNAVAAVLGSEYTYTTGLYPQLTGFTTSTTTSVNASLFSVTPILLSASSDANGDNGVNGDITLGSSSLAISLAVSNTRAEVSGTTVSMVMKGDFQLVASLDGCVKVWYLISHVGIAQGTEENPFTIDNLSAFINFRDQLNSGEAFTMNGDPVNAGGENNYFALTADMDINPDYSNGYAEWSEGNVPAEIVPWVAMGTPDAPFKGHFSGNGHTIAGIYGEPLFGVVEGGIVENVGLIRGYVNSGKHFGYVTDGLIMHYDGIMNTRAGHDANAKQWEDLVGTFDLTPFTFNSLEWGEDHSLLKGDSAFWASGMSQRFLNILGNYSFEFVTYMDCDRTTPTSRGLMGGLGSGTNTLNIASYGGSGRAEVVGNVDVSANDDEVITLSYAKTTGCFLNGTYKSGSFPSTIDDNSTAHIFGNSYINSWGVRGWNDSIYAIRVYNRSLTSSEIKHNADIDKLRFITKQGGGYTGSIVGINLGGTVSHCFSALDIVDGSGVVGYNTGTVTNCVYAGNATGVMSAAVVGNNTTGATVSHCLAQGTLEGKTAVGGNVANVNNVYYDNQLAPNVTTSGVTGMTTSALSNGTFTPGSDFTTASGSYPRLTVFGSHPAANAIAQAAVLSGNVKNASGNITLSGCDQDMVWTASAGITVNTCAAVADGRGGALLSLSYEGKLYKTLRLHLGTVEENLYYINNLTALDNFRKGINSGKTFYYNPTLGSEDFSNTNQDGWVAVNAFGEGATFVLTADIDMNNTIFTPIGTVGAGVNLKPFKGTFDGQNHVIRHFRTGNYAQPGLFRYSQGVIKNLGMVDGELYYPQAHTSALCAFNAGTIQKCYVKNSKRAKDGANYAGTGYGNAFLVSLNMGGTISECYVEGDTMIWSANFPTNYQGRASLCAYNYLGLIKDCSVKNCLMETTSTNIYHRAGLVCGQSYFGHFQNCSVENSSLINHRASDRTTFHGTGYFGVICGIANHSVFDSCYAKNSIVECEHLYYIGGLVGTLGYGSMNYCYNEGGLVRGAAYVGGIVGEATANFYHCHNSAKVEGVYTRVGGIAGIIYGRNVKISNYWSEITYCYNTGDISNPTIDWYTGETRDNDFRYPYLGGIVGQIHNGDTYRKVRMRGCFNSGSITNHGKSSDASSTAVSGLVGTIVQWNGTDYYTRLDIANCFNVGKVDGGDVRACGIAWGLVSTSQGFYNAGRVLSSNVAFPITATNTYGTHRYYDSQMCPNAYRFSRDTVLTTADMLGNGLRGRLGNDEDWVFTSGMYPRIKGIENEPASIAAATPVNLYNVSADERENVLTVNHNFTTGQGTSANEVNWIVAKGDDIVTVSGSNYTLNSHARGVIEMHAAVNDSVYKKVELFVGMDQPLLITSRKELEKFRDGINSRDYFYYDVAQDTFSLTEKPGLITVPIEGEAATFKLTTDIDLDSIPWIPIGHDSAIFKGNFMGNNHTITDLYIENNTTRRFLAGLFGRVSQGYIEKLGMINPVVKATAINSSAGAIAAESGGRIDSCYTVGGYIESRDRTGGICGYHIGWINASGWSSAAPYYVPTDTTCMILRCWNSAEVAGSWYVGGIAGTDLSIMRWCYNMGEVHTRNTNDQQCRVGGLTGSVSQFITESYNMGVVKGSKQNSYYTGGLTGEGRAVFSYNAGEVIGNKSANTGGITGYYNGNNGNDYCYNIGRVTGSGTTSPFNGLSNRTTYRVFFDTLMCPGTKTMNWHTSYKYPALKTVQMLGNGLNLNNNKGLVENTFTYYQFEAGLYPQLKHFAGTDASIASVTPVLLQNDETVLSVAHNFTVGQGHSVTWAKVAGGGVIVAPDSVRLDGNIGIATLQNSISGVNYKKVRILLMSPEKPLIIKCLAQLDTFSRAINSNEVFFYKFADSTFTTENHTDELGYLEVAAGGDETYFRLHDTIFDFAAGGYTDWTPIGKSGRPFSGHFNGHNVPIRNMIIDHEGNYLGLFGYNDGTIDSVILVNATVTDKANEYVGALCGYTINAISDCESNNGHITSSGRFLGGLVGYSNGGALVNLAHRHGSVTRATGVNKRHTGGVVGYITTAKLKGCHNDTSTVVGYDYTGGVAGYVYALVIQDSIKQCYTVGGTVSDNLTESSNTNMYVGGVVGYRSRACVMQCHNEGTEVTSWGNYVAGLFGGSDNDGWYYYDCYNTGNVTGRDAVAGIKTGRRSGYRLFNKGDVTARLGVAYGISQEFDHSHYLFNIGNVTGGSAAYGIVGTQINTVKYCINAGQITANTSLACGISYYDYSNPSPYFEHCMNVGEVVSIRSNASGMLNQEGYPTKCYNAGRIMGSAKSAAMSCQWMSVDCFYDRQMAPNLTYDDRSVGYSTEEMIGTASVMRGTLGEDYWIYEEGMYPRPKWTEVVSMPYVREAAIVACTPVFFSTTPEEQHVNAATEDFTFGDGNAAKVKWSVEKGKGLTINGYNAETNPIGIVYVHAALQAGPNVADSVYKRMRIVVTSDMYPIPIKDKNALIQFRAGVNSLDNSMQQPFYFNITDSTFTTVRPADSVMFKYFEIPAGGEGVHFKLLSDVDLSPGTWTPIGNNSAQQGVLQFRGYFNGDNHTISNLTNNSSKKNSWKGLFGFATGAEIKNIYVKNVDISNGDNTLSNNRYYGAIVGYAQGCTISGCRADGTIKGVDIGGIVGYSNNSTIENCYNAVNLVHNPNLAGNNTSVGGITSYSNTEVKNCYNVGDIDGNSAASYVGGIVGNGGAVQCYNLGHVTGEYTTPYSISGTNLYTNSFNDLQLIPGLEGATNKLTVNMTGDALKTYLGDDGTWVYADNMYPRLSGLDTSAQAIVYATPVYLYSTQDVNTVRMHFNVGHEEGVTWDRVGTGHALDIDNINDPSAEYNCMVVDCGEDTLKVTKNGVTRIIPIRIYVDRLEVTTFEAHTCGQPFFWDVSNKYYTRTGTFTETFATREGCDSVVSLKLTIPEHELSGAISSIQISCFGEDDAILTAAITGGFGEGYLYKWIDAADDTLNIAPLMDPEDLNLNPLTTGPGSYKVLAMDALHNECQYTTPAVVIEQPAKLVTSVVDYGTLCGGTGNATPNRYITLSIAGGRAPYTVSYTVNGSTTNRNVPASEAASGPITLEYLNVGTYTVSIRDNGTIGHTPCDTTFNPITFDGDPTVYTVTAASYSGTYDGNYHDARFYSIASNGTVISGAEAIPSTTGYVLHRNAEYKDSLIVKMENDGVYEKNAGLYHNNINSCSVLRVYADGVTSDEEVRCRYNISLENRNVDIAKREITLTSASATEVYTGGGNLTAESVTSTGDTWVTGEEPTYSGYAALDHIGSMPNTFTINYVSGVDYATNYTIHVVNGTLIYLSSNADVVFTAPTKQKTYDGKEWTTDTVAFLTTTNLDLTIYRYELTINSASHIKNVGTVASVIDTVMIYNRSTNELVNGTTFAGHIVLVSGNLEVTPLSISLSSTSATEIYSGDTLRRTAVGISRPFVEGEVSAAPEAIGKIADVGSVPNTIDYHPVAGVFDINNYNLTISTGTLEITLREVSFTGESLTTEYTGDTIRLTTITKVNMVDGHTLNGLTYLAKGKDVGDYPGVFTGESDYQILDAQGHDVKSNYNVTSITPGLLKITSNDKDIVITSKSGSTIYTGSNYRKDEYTVTYDGLDMSFISPTQFILSTGDTLTITSTATAVKHVEDNAPNNNTYTYRLSGSVNYEGTITTNFGTLEISPRPLNLKSDNGEKVYDGAELTATTIVEQASSYGFAVGEGFDYSNFAAPVNVGVYTNTFDYAPMSGTDTRLTDYIVSTAYGTLTITKAECTLTPDNVTRQFGEANPTTWEYTLTDFAVNDNEADLKDTLTLHGQPVISTTATINSVPGTYPITADPAQIDLWNYTVTPQPGTLTIEPLALVLKANGDTVMYDGNEHAVSEFTVEYNGTVYASTSGVATITVADTAYHITAVTANPSEKVNVGIYANSFSGTPVVTRADDDAAVRTSWFNITTHDSALVIIPDTMKIYVTSYDKEWAYDGTAHSYTKYTVKRGTSTYEIADGETAEVTLATGDKLTISSPRSVTNVSETAANNNTYTVTLQNSGNYISNVIVKTMGTLTITPATALVTITGHTGGFDCDGSNHTVHGYDVVIEDPLNIYAMSDFTFSPAEDSIVTESAVGTYTMELDGKFTNINTNYNPVTFKVTNGSMEIVDTIKPTFTAPADLTLCRDASGNIDAPISVTLEPTNLADACTPATDLTVAHVDLDTLPASDLGPRVIRRQWTVTDAEGNSTVKIQNITINPVATVNAVEDKKVCHNATTAVSFSTTNTGGDVTYSWTNDETGIGLAASGNGDIAAFTATNTTNAALTATITVTPHFTNDGVTCDGPAETFTITVNPQVQMNKPANDTICHNTQMAAVNFTTAITDGSMSYAWTRDNANVTGIATSGTGNIAATTLSNLTTSAQTVTFTVRPTYTNNGISCEGADSTFVVVVNPQVQMNKPANDTICHNTQMAAVNFATAITDGSMSYAWTRDNDNVTGIATSGTGNIAATTLSNLTATAQTVTFTVRPTYTNNGISCEGADSTFVVVVNPQVRMDEVADQTICHGENMSAVTFSTDITDGTMSYAWTRDNTTNVTGIAASGTGDIAAATLSNLTTTAQVVTFTVRPTYTNNGISCEGADSTFTVTVNPTAEVEPIENQVVCNNANTDEIIFVSTNAGGTTTFTWENDETSIGLAATGSGNIAAFTATNTTNAPVTATIVVTPHFTKDGVTCDGPTESFTITVNPTAEVESIENQVVCNNASTTTVTFATTNTGGTTTYTWENNETGIGLAATGSGDIAAFTATNITNAPLIATIVVTPHFSNGGVTCDGPTKTFTITVRPSVLTPGNITFSCPDTTVTLNYGVCDTLIELHRTLINNMSDMTVVLDSAGIPADHRYRADIDQPYVITWRITDDCGDYVEFQQRVTVNFPPCGAGVTAIDGDGIEYPTVQVGCNCWTARNARSTHYANDNELITPAPMQYPGTENHPEDTIYGKLYTYNAATRIPLMRSVPTQVQGICPNGWHIPDDEDFADLMVHWEADDLLSTEHWLTPGTNLSSFTMEPGGKYNSELDRYEYLYVKGYLWSYTPGATTIANACEFGSTCGTVEIIPATVTTAFSVRCVHD